MSCKTLLIIPPFTQLNTPYPATAYLKGFLESKGKEIVQEDLSIQLFCKIFSKDFLVQIFEEVSLLEHIECIDVLDFADEYLNIVDDVIAFLQHKREDLHFCDINYYPHGHRISRLDQASKAYRSLSQLDKGKHLATLFIEEIGDFIQLNVDEFFSFTKYAEQIGTSASSFNQIATYLEYDLTLIEEAMLDLLDEFIQQHSPHLIGFTIPFPGNLFAALRCAQHIKIYYPTIAVEFGGGYCNTELRSLSDPTIFQLVDYITLDDGEAPMLRIIENIEGVAKIEDLERTYIEKNGLVVYQNKLPNTIFAHRDLPAPNYENLFKGQYLSFLDIINPMHRLWSDQEWLKLTVSHGCYWKQCSFCDVSLDYIGNYQNTTAEIFVDKMAKLMYDTGINGFHFVDEAAPPKMLKAIAKEIIERGLKVRWWTNIRFEKTFDEALCNILAKSGCIAVTGGLEVASDRLLQKMKKGVDIAQVARVTKAFKQNGILVHAYLMYGFPTQTAQETTDALEVVRQLFKNKCLDSAFWHRFTCTIHSPIGINPEEFDIEITGPGFEGFAQNDLMHNDPKGTDHERYTMGLNDALGSYLIAEGLDEPIQNWFDFDIDEIGISKSLIASALAH